MKYLLTTLAFVGLISFTGCKKDDNDGNGKPSLKNAIVGSWEIEALEQRNGNMSSSGITLGTFEADGSNFVGDITFHQDGTTESNVGYDVTMNISIQVPGLPPQTSTQTQNVPQQASTGTYEVISNDKLKLTSSLSNGESMTMDVQSYSDNSMELFAQMDSSMVQSGMMVNTSFDYYLRLKKK